MVGTDPKRIVKEAKKIIMADQDIRISDSGYQRIRISGKQKKLKRPKKPKYWDGKAAVRIVRILRTIR